MALRGGYKIIDLKGVNHTSGVGMVHKGIYNSIEETQKPILLSGLTLEEIEYNDMYIEVTLVGTIYMFIKQLITSTGPKMLSIRVEDTDVVTISLENL